MAVNVAAPVPPLEIDIVPVVTLEAFKFVSEAPEPEKAEAETLVADMDVHVKRPDNVPPLHGKNNDNVEDIGVPFLYITAQLILVNTPKA